MVCQMRITLEIGHKFIWFAIIGKTEREGIKGYYERHIECITKAELVRESQGRNWEVGS